jgi:hypothetical protein
MTGIFEWIPTLHAVRAVLGVGEGAAEDVLGRAVIYAGAGSITLGLGAWNWIKAGRAEDGTRGRDPRAGHRRLQHCGPPHAHGQPGTCSRRNHAIPVVMRSISAALTLQLRAI